MAGQLAFWVALLAAVSAAASCSRPDEGGPATPPGTGGAEQEPGWLRGDVDARFALVARHLRGFDVAMVEVGYRYVELYWAGHDHNWEYAAYQLDKIETAVANGVERRPRRAASARMLDGTIGPLRAAIDARDRDAFDAAFATLTATCNACHHAERVPFMTVAPPAQRLSPVRFPAAAPRPRDEGGAPVPRPRDEGGAP